MNDEKCQIIIIEIGGEIYGIPIMYAREVKQVMFFRQIKKLSIIGKLLLSFYFVQYFIC